MPTKILSSGGLVFLFVLYFIFSVYFTLGENGGK